MVRNSFQDAPSEEEYQTLLESAADLPEPYDAECLFILVCAGRLGMRGGEICHMREDWVDWQNKQIEIPLFDPCDHGITGGVCGYCRSQAELALSYDDDLTMEEALDQRWEPKTPNSVRAIPFDFHPFTESVISEFFKIYDHYPRSRVSVNRRVDRVLEAAGFDTGEAYPHSLRATAASWHAYRDLPPVALQSLFGWKNISIAQKYIRLSGNATAKALAEAHGD